MTTFKYRFLCIIRKKTLIFWNLVFPLILTTFFGLTLPNTYNTVEFETIPIAIVESEQFKQDVSFQETLNVLDEAEEPLFDITYTSLAEAQSLLGDGEIDGIIVKEETFQVFVKSTGINPTIIQTFMDEYLQQTSIITNLVTQGASIDQVLASMNNTNEYIHSQTNDNSTLTSVYFYTILAMCCLYGGFISMNCISSLQANQSDVGARNSMAPQSKAKMIFNDFIISYFLEFMILMILMLYMKYFINIEFGEHIGYILLNIITGIFAGNALGVLIGVVIVKKIDMKTGLITAITMFMSMLSGMMFVQMKYYVETYVPLLAKINPANMITDGLYSLYYYGPNERYFMNIVSLCIFAGICYFISYLTLRRKSYANI